ncbi:translesion error-prone DNA polymerase V autoproteolytic subunit [Candidatus Woesebacteria bacterium]|nr:translesion error-prone DNA polymerase V autoproteolytic subunit [Candidatus Woesebacteria bacterium]
MGMSSLLIQSADSKKLVPLTLYETKIPAGFPSPADDFADTKLDLNEHLIRHPAATFFVKVSGDSMTGVGIFDGDMLIVDRSLEASQQSIVIAALDGELTVKRLGMKKGRYLLFSENEKYPPIEIADESDFSIWGVVTAVVHSFS